MSPAVEEAEARLQSAREELVNVRARAAQAHDRLADLTIKIGYTPGSALANLQEWTRAIAAAQAAVEQAERAVRHARNPRLQPVVRRFA